MAASASLKLMPLGLSIRTREPVDQAGVSAVPLPPFSCLTGVQVYRLSRSSRPIVFWEQTPAYVAEYHLYVAQDRSTHGSLSSSLDKRMHLQPWPAFSTLEHAPKTLIYLSA